jgi:hypothetical protein
MARPLLLLLLLPLLPACQNAAPQKSASSPAAPEAQTFDQATVQTYDRQTGEFQQQPPFGARSNLSN